MTAIVYINLSVCRNVSFSDSELFSLQYGFVGRWLSPGRPTMGALDFGGASTQITFVTHDEVEDEHDTMKLRLYGQEYSLYTHSFLCYGQDQVLKRLLAHLVKVNLSLRYSSVKATPLYF